MTAFDRKMISILEWILPLEFQESIIGDLLESHIEDTQRIGQRWANIKMLWNTIRLIHPYFLFKRKYQFMNLSLFKRNISLSLRSSRKHPLHTTINLFGLGLGLAAFFLIRVYVGFEHSFDETHPEAESLYRVNQTLIWSPEGGIMGSTPPPLAEALRTNFPEVKSTVRINTPGPKLMQTKENLSAMRIFQEQNILAADSNFFDFFDFALLHGDPNSALNGINQVVISKEAATKYFDKENVIGETLLMGEDKIPLVITGVTTEQKPNIHFHFDFLLSMPTNPNVEAFDWSWIWTQVVTYAKLAPQTVPEELEEKVNQLSDNFVIPCLDRLGMSMDDFVSVNSGWNFYLQPVEAIRLESASIGNRIGPVNQKSTIRVLSLLGWLILFIAIVNFVNLSTAKSNTRLKEIAVKRSIGAPKKALISQFLTEANVMVVLSIPLAIFFFIVLRNLVTSIGTTLIPVSGLLEFKEIIIIVVGLLGIGLFAGSYPAFYLTRYSPQKIFKGIWKDSRGDRLFRNFLVGFQFAIAIGLIAFSFSIFRQLSYLTTADLGFNQDQILVIDNVDLLDSRIESFRNEVSAIPGIRSAALAMDMPGQGNVGRYLSN